MGLKETTYLCPLAVWVIYAAILQACSPLWTHLTTKTCHNVDFFVTEWPPYKILAMPLLFINACIHMWLLYFPDCISLKKTADNFPTPPTVFLVKWQPRNGHRNSILMTCLGFSDLGSASDWLKQNVSFFFRLCKSHPSKMWLLRTVNERGIMKF